MIPDNPVSSATLSPGNSGNTGRIAAPGFSLPEAVLSGEFSAAEFEQNVQNIFNRFAVELHDRYLQIFDQEVGVKRQFLENATKTVLACPPPRLITDTIPNAMLENQLFGIITGNYLLSFTPTRGMIWPTVGYDLAFEINKELLNTGHSIITNNSRVGIKESWNGRVQGLEMAWDGHIAPYNQVHKIREIGRGASAVVETYMKVIANSDEET